MPSELKFPSNSKSKISQFDALTLTMSDEDDDFQNPSHAISVTQNLILSSFKKQPRNPSSQPLKPSNGTRSSKKSKLSITIGKENTRIPSVLNEKRGFASEKGHISASTDSGLSQSSRVCGSLVQNHCFVDSSSIQCNENSIKSVLLEPCGNYCSMTENGCSDDCLIGDNVPIEYEERKGIGSNRGCSLTVTESRLFESNNNCSDRDDDNCSIEDIFGDIASNERNEVKGIAMEKGYLTNSIESRLASNLSCSSMVDNGGLDEVSLEDFEPGTQLNMLMRLCSKVGEEENSSRVGCQEANGSSDGIVECPLCGTDISDLSEELRQLHTNDCLDKIDIQKVVPPSDETRSTSPQQVDVSPVLEWLRSLDLSRYEEIFVREEIDFDTLQWLTEEDLFSIGVTALGPRKKIVHALSELRKESMHADEMPADASKAVTDETSKLAGNKLITEYFLGSSVNRNKGCAPSRRNHEPERCSKVSVSKRTTARNQVRNGKLRDIPSWCCIPGTPFRVDAFRYLRGDCSHWFLTHFHIDHYQGLTRNFCYGKIYCSSITAQLVNTKIGIPWDRLQVLPLNQKISISGIYMTCLDANHCPGSIIILFEPPNGKAVLHTGDFRYSEEMANISVLQTCHVHTLILDTTYCNPQYDFPKQEAVIQFVIDAIQAEAFNPKTLFLIGSYTIGKERLFLEVARVLRKKVYVGAAKLRLLECLGLPREDIQWLTVNEQESHIHVVPMWTIASFKRMKHTSNQYLRRFSSIVAFSPTGWTFGKGKKKSPGRRWQQGTVIRYEVPYSEHCSFTELREFVKFVSPQNIIPSVNNNGQESTDAMVALLMS